MQTRNKANVVVALLAFALTAPAQTSRGNVTGTALDPTGVAVRGARITLTGVDTGLKRSTVSNDAGIYRFDAVDFGVYELQVQHPGFRSHPGAGINVEANRVTSVDPRLEVGAAETIIEVNSESTEILIKDNPLRGWKFPPREVRDLPLPGLNPLSLARTLPGANGGRGQLGHGRLGKHGRPILD